MNCKYFFACFALLLSIYVYGQEGTFVNIGAFKSNGNHINAYAYMSPDSSHIYYFKIPTFYTSSARLVDPAIYIANSDTLIDNLTKIYSKYKEWTDISKKNNTGKFSKDIDITFPIIKACDKNRWSNGIVEEMNYNINSKKFKFNLYNPEKGPALYYKTQRISKTRFGSVNYEMAISFINPEEFASLIEILKIENVKNKIKNGSIDSLFK